MSAFLSVLYKFTYMSMFGVRLFTMTPSRWTSGGRRLITWLTRFMTFTVAWLGSVPIWKTT